MFCFIFNLKPVYFTKICISLFIFVGLYIFNETIASECCTFHMALHIYGFLYARGQCRTIDRETSFISWWDHWSSMSRRLSDSHWILQALIRSYQIIHLTCRNFICQHSAITETTVKQHPLAIIWFDTHWESPGFIGIHANISGIKSYASLRDI